MFMYVRMFGLAKHVEGLPKYVSCTNCTCDLMIFVAHRMYVCMYICMYTDDLCSISEFV